MPINFKFPLRKVRRGFPDGNETTVAALKEDIKTLVLTRKGERVIQPGIGTNVAVLAGELFNNVNKEEMRLRIENEIREAVDKYLPIVSLQRVNIRTYEDDDKLKYNEILVIMAFNMRSNNAFSETVEFKVKS